MELFAADGHDAGGCERVTGKSGMRPFQCHFIQRRRLGKRRTVGNPVPDGTDNAFGHGNDLRSEAEPILIRRTVDVTDNGRIPDFPEQCSV